MSKKGFIGGISAAVIIVIAIVIGTICLTQVPAGYVGVIYDVSTGISDETLSQGFYFVAPTKKVTLYSIGIEQSYLTSKEEGDSPNDDSFEVPTSDGKGLTVDLTFTYRFDADRVPEIFTRFKGRSGSEVLTSFIKPNIISWTKEVTAKYPVTEILGDKRAELNVAVLEYLQTKFESYGIKIESASLINVDPDDQTRQAIQKKVTAQQELELANIERETAKVQAEKDKEVAQVQAEQARIKAEGEAEAKKIAAEAEAQANKKISESLTAELIEKIKYDKWNGEVPKVTSENTPVIKID